MKDIISKRRKELGMTQQQLADKLFISDRVISKWETGKSIPDTIILVDLCKALDLTLDQLLNNDTAINKSEYNTNIKDKIKIKYTNILVIDLTIVVLSFILFCLYGISRWTTIEQGKLIALFIAPIIGYLASVIHYVLATNKIKYNFSKIESIDKTSNKIFFITLSVLFLVGIIFTIVFGLIVS